MSKAYDTTKMIEDYSRSARMMFALVQPAELRTILEKSLDLQVETAKYATKTVTDSLSMFTTAK